MPTMRTAASLAGLAFGLPTMYLTTLPTRRPSRSAVGKSIIASPGARWLAIRPEITFHRVRNSERSRIQTAPTTPASDQHPAAHCPRTAPRAGSRPAPPSPVVLTPPEQPPGRGRLMLRGRSRGEVDNAQNWWIWPLGPISQVGSPSAPIRQLV